MTNVLDLIGKFHPLLLHLPIGILVYAYLHLGFDLFVKKKNKPVDIKFALGIGALTAVLSSGTGYLLSLNGEYGGDLLDWHKWLGIGTAICAVLIFLFYNNKKEQKQFYVLFSGFILLLMITGHYGGSLTHGEGFLSLNSTEDSTPKIIEDVNQAHVFHDLIMPIAKRKCISCHNPKKKKGELLLGKVEGWVNGGKSGKLLIPGDAANSLLSNRFHLGLSDEKHMPPSGKLQLDAEEIVFIDWWITTMTDYEASVADLSPPEKIMKYIKSKLDYSFANVPAIDDRAIAQLQSEGIPASRIRKDQPWISVDFKRGYKLQNSDLKKLLKHKDNIRELNLSKTNLTDKWISKINEFHNLKSLDLSQNEISSAGISKLTKLSNLEHLNVYGSRVDVRIFDQLASFPVLNDIYLWQTGIDEKDIASLDLPKDLRVNIGQDLDAFEDLQLLSPTIENSDDIFQDTMSVNLSHVASNAKIHFTIDGSSPTVNSAIFTQPIQLVKTCELKAIAIMTGWERSAEVRKSFLKSRHKPLACKVMPSPNEKYKSEGDSTLINLSKASDQFSDGKWLGFSAEDVSITLDLGMEKEVKAISFGSLRDYKSYIFTPLASSVSTSIDGVVFNKMKEEKYDQITGPEDNMIKNYIIDIPTTNARYIKLDIIAQKKNPNWHAAPGADCWLFLDEVVVE